MKTYFGWSFAVFRKSVVAFPTVESKLPFPHRTSETSGHSTTRRTSSIKHFTRSPAPQPWRNHQIRRVVVLPESGLHH